MQVMTSAKNKNETTIDAIPGPGILKVLTTSLAVRRKKGYIVNFNLLNSSIEKKVGTVSGDLDNPKEIE